MREKSDLRSLAEELASYHSGWRREPCASCHGSGSSEDEPRGRLRGARACGTCAGAGHVWRSGEALRTYTDTELVRLLGWRGLG